MTSVPTTPPASSGTALPTSSYYTPASGWTGRSITVSSTASEGPSNVPGSSIAASQAAASAASASASAAASSAKSSGPNFGLALGLGLGLGLLLLFALFGGMYIIRQRRIERLTFAKRASRIKETMRTVEDRPGGLESPSLQRTSGYV